MTEPAIRTENLGKRYKITPLEPLHTLLLRRLRRGTGERADAPEPEKDIWALRNFSTRIDRGEVVGIIGPNGAGKTTLLKLLSRLTDPTEGRATIRGQVRSLIAVGTGFHPDLTGRENVFVNGAILGMSRREIAGKFDEIVAFSGVEKFIDTPVKWYSSGMTVRLGFAVAAHMDPDILLVDEVLAVGDASFQKACLGKMDEVSRQGRTVVFVSHQMERIIGLCRRVIRLDEGQVCDDGPTREVVDKYLRETVGAGDSMAALGQRKDREGTGALRFTEVSVCRDGSSEHGLFSTGDHVAIRLAWTSEQETLRYVGFRVWFDDALGRQIVCFATRLTGQDFEDVPGTGSVICRVPRLTLAPGTYYVRAVARVHGETADYVNQACSFEVTSSDFFGSGHGVGNLGVFVADQDWQLLSPAESPVAGIDAAALSPFDELP